MKKINVLILLFVLLVGKGIAQNIPSYVPTNGLKAWYPFTGNANDSSGSSLHGNVVGATLAKDRFGKSNCAYNFGDNQYITIPNSGTLNYFPLTVSLWYNASTYPSGGECNIFSKYISATWNGFQILYGDNTRVDNLGKIENNGFGTQSWYVRNMSNKCIGYYNEPAFLQSNISINKWYHYVFVLDETGGKIYVDGNLISTHKWTGTAGPSSNNFLWKIGGQYGSSKYFNGLIDDIGIWNRPLTESEITNLFKVSRCNVPEAPSTASSYQEYCAIDYKTFSDIKISGTNIKWYRNEIGGDEIKSYYPISTGTFYATQTVNGCESEKRLKIQLNVNNSARPTSNLRNQQYCFSDKKTVKDIIVDQSNVVWSSNLKNGQILNPSDLLTTDTYYARTLIGNCRSQDSLVIEIKVHDPIYLTAIPKHIECNGLNGSVTLSSSGAAPLTYGGDATTNLSAGTYNYTVIDANGCTSTASATINAAPITPETPVIENIEHPTCINPTGSVSLSGLPSTGTWTIIGSPAGVATGNGTTGNISGLAPGVYTFTVSNSNGCKSSSTFQVVINSQPSLPSPPVIETITQPSCTLATGSVLLSGLPSGGAWTVTASPGGATITGTSGTTTAIFSGLAASTYSFTVTNSWGCTSEPSVKLATINPQPSTPNIPVVETITQPSCANPTGSVSLSGLPSSGAWTVTASPGGAIITGTSGTTTATFIGLAAGKYAFTVKNNFGCSSSLSSYITINTPSTLSTSAGIIEVIGNGPVCVGSSSRFTIRNGVAGETVKYSINGGAEVFTVLKADGTAEIDLGNQTTTQTIILTKIVTISGCESSVTSLKKSATISINPSPTKGAAISVVANGPFCVNGTGVFTISGGESNGSVKYKIDGGAEQTQVLDNSGSATINLGNVTSNKTIVLTSLLSSNGCYSPVTSPSKTATISIGELSNASNKISVYSSGNVCAGGNGSFIIKNGEANSVVLYTLNNKIGEIKLDQNGFATINLSNVTDAQKITLLSIYSATGCKTKISSLANNATIMIENQNSVTTLGEQNFCWMDNKKVKDLYVTGSNVLWFNSSVGGTQLNPEEKLTTKVYYAVNAACLNSERVKTNVVVRDPMPIKTDPVVNFCEGIGKLTIADLKPNGGNFAWFHDEKTSSELPSNTLLTNTSYFVGERLGSCTFNRTKVTVVFSSTIILGDTLVCKGNKAQLKVYNTRPSGNYTIGSKGPAGGYIFYDQGKDINGWRYLESAPNNIENSKWGCGDVNISSANNLVIGSGLENSMSIVKNCNESGIAAKKCLDYTLNGYDDWFLPSQNEFAQIYSNLIKNGIGSFDVGPIPSMGTLYWTSSQLTPASGSHFCLECGGNFYQYAKVYELYVRPVRRFSSTASSNTSFYKWSTGDTTETISVYPDKNTTYWVDITSNGSTCRKYITVKVNEATPPILSIVNQNTICSDGFARLNLVSNSGSNYFNWYRNNNLFLSGTNILTTKENGEYYAADLSNKCSSKSNSVFVNFNDAKISIQPIASLILKKSNEIELIANPKGGTFSGEGVSGNFFYPNKCRLGTKKITYSLNSSSNICRGTATISTIIVDSTENICHFYDTVKVTKYDTIKTYTSVTDTLKIKLKLTTGVYTKQFNNIKIYPNPTVSDVVVDFGNYKYMQGYYLSITDVNGKKLNAIPITQQLISVNLGSLGGAGIYFFNFHDNNSKVIESKKIVLE